MAKNTDSGTRRLGFISQITLLIAASSLASYFTSLCSSFLIGTLRIIIALTSDDYGEN